MAEAVAWSADPRHYRPPPGGQRGTVRTGEQDEWGHVGMSVHRFREWLNARPLGWGSLALALYGVGLARLVARHHSWALATLAGGAWSIAQLGVPSRPWRVLTRRPVGRVIAASGWIFVALVVAHVMRLVAFVVAVVAAVTLHYAARAFGWDRGTARKKDSA
jgi:hypothetical protein